MPVYSIVLINKYTKTVLSTITHLNDFYFWERPKIAEIIDHTSRYVTAKTDCGSMKAFLYEGYLCSIYITNDGLSGVLLSDETYPSRVASESLYNYVQQFMEHNSNWKHITGDTNLNFVPEYLEQIQKPEEVDKLMKIQRDLDQTRQLMISNVEELINRGDRLDELEERTEKLLIEGRKFKKGAQDFNRWCCVIL